jgi:hypothetical protein
MSEGREKLCAHAERLEVNGFTKFTTKGKPHGGGGGKVDLKVQ